MLKKTITFNNVDGVPVTKDLYFNISTIELTEKEALSNQTYSQRLAEIGSSEQLSEVYPLVMEFLQDGFGVRTEDGDFEKDNTHWLKFKNSLAYDALMEDLLMDPANNGTKLADFITAMLPESLQAQVKERQATPGFRPGADTSRPTPPVAGQPQPVVDLGHVDATPAQPVQVAPAEPHPEWPVHGTPEEIIVQQTAENRIPDLPGQPNLQDPQRYQQ